jgi:uncharacterized protein
MEPGIARSRGHSVARGSNYLLRVGKHVKMPSTSTMRSVMPTNKDIMRAAYGSFASGDVPAVLALMDPNIEWTEAEGWPLYDGTFVGPQAIVDGVFLRLGEIGDNFSVNLDQLVADGDTVVALETYTWNRKDSGGPAEV